MPCNCSKLNMSSTGIFLKISLRIAWQGVILHAGSPYILINMVFCGLFYNINNSRPCTITHAQSRGRINEDIAIQSHMVRQFMNSIFKILQQHFFGRTGDHKKPQPHQAKTQITLQPDTPCVRAYRITTTPTCAAKTAKIITLYIHDRSKYQIITDQFHLL